MSRYSKEQLEAMTAIESSARLTPAMRRMVNESVDQALGSDPSKGPTGPAPMPTPDPAKKQANALEKLRSMQAAGVRIL